MRKIGDVKSGGDYSKKRTLDKHPIATGHGRIPNTEPYSKIERTREQERKRVLLIYTRKTCQFIQLL